MLVSPYFTVRNIMPFVLCVIFVRSKDITVQMEQEQERKANAG